MLLKVLKNKLLLSQWLFLKDQSLNNNWVLKHFCEFNAQQYKAISDSFLIQPSQNVSYLYFHRQVIIVVFRKFLIHRLILALLFLSLKGDINKGVKITKEIVIYYYKIIKDSIETLNFSSRGYSREENEFPRKQILKHVFILALY